MPKDQCEFGHLLPLLAQLKQRGLPRSLVQKICNVSHSPSVLLAHIVGRILVGLLLCRGGGGGLLSLLMLMLLLLLLSSLGLGLLSLLSLLLLLSATVLLNGLLLLLLLLLLVHPRGVSLGVELVVPVEVRHHVRVWPLHAYR